MYVKRNINNLYIFDYESNRFKKHYFNKLNDIEDFAMLKGILNYIEEYSSKSEVIAYTGKGKPLNKQNYIKKVKDANASIEAGRYTTIEDLKKEIKNW